MKKLIAIIGCALLLVALSVTAFAADLNMELTASKAVVQAGDIVTFTISMQETASLTAGGFKLDGLYDTEVFEYVSGSCLVKNAAITNVGFINDKLTGSFMLMSAADVTGGLFEVQMRVKNTAPIGKTTIAPTVSARDSSGNVSASVNSLELEVAELAMNLTADKTTAVRGDVVTFTITAEKIVDCMAGGFKLQNLYDTEVFEFVSGNCPLSGIMLQNVGYVSGILSGSFMYAQPAEVSGTLFTIQMKVKDTAPFGMTTVAPTTSARNSAGTVEATVNALELNIVCTHDWGTGEVTTAPACEAEGVRTYTCSICRQTKTEAVAMLGHKMDDGQITTAPACETEGVRTYTCVNGCGKTETEAVAKLGHKMDDGQITTAPTCTEDGVRTYTCTNNCGKTETEAVAKLGHKMDDGQITTAPACETEGVRTYTCTNGCGHTTVEVVAKLGHSPETTVTVEPTCTEDGEQITTCTVCQKLLKTEAVEKLGHNPQTTVTKEPNYVEDGEQVTACATCQEVFLVEVLDKLPGNLDGNETLDEEDVVYLLQHVLMPEDFQVVEEVNYDHNETVDEDDVVYLLQHLLMPDDFPLR